MTVRKLSGHTTKTNFNEERMLHSILEHDYKLRVAEAEAKEKQRARERKAWEQEKETRLKHSQKTYSYTIGCISEPETMDGWNFATRYEYN